MSVDKIQATSLLALSDMENMYDKMVRMNKANHRIAELRRDREWLYRESRRYPLHQGVRKLLDALPPADLDALILEWPHESTKDEARLAYTRNEEKGIADRQEVTTTGKYLRRHWPNVPDHIIRDIAAIHDNMEFKILTDMPAMMDALKRGPYTCMRWESCENWDEHPYHVYDPAMGWGMAVRIDGAGDIAARALTFEGKLKNGTDVKYFVRSFKKCPQGGYSYADEALEGWLKEQGFEKASGYAYGTPLKLIRKNRYSIIAPYLDGDEQRVDEYDGHLIVSDCGSYVCDNTNGTASSCERCECECCGEYDDEDEMHTVGYHGDTLVCQNCFEEDYMYVRGRDRSEYYVRNDDVVEVNGRCYDENYLDENGIVSLASGGYSTEDEAFCCAVDGEWYNLDDGTCDTVDYPGDYVCIDNTWTSEVTGRLYSTDEEEYTNYEGETCAFAELSDVERGWIHATRYGAVEFDFIDADGSMTPEVTSSRQYPYGVMPTERDYYEPWPMFRFSWPESASTYSTSAFTYVVA